MAFKIEASLKNIRSNLYLNEISTEYSMLFFAIFPEHSLKQQSRWGSADYMNLHFKVKPL